MDLGRWIALCGMCLLLAACTSPVRGVRTDREEAHRELMRSAVTEGKMSWATRNVLAQRGLVEPFDDDPEATLAILHAEMLAVQGHPDLLSALAELSFLHAEDVEEPEAFLAAAVYAWALIFPDEGGQRPGPLDPRLRAGADLYNWSLTAAFTDEEGEFVPRGGRFALPFGTLDVAFDADQARAGNRSFGNLIPVTEVEVAGLAMRFRWPGIGSPLAASTTLMETTDVSADMVAPHLRIPLTALLRFTHSRHALLEGEPLKAALELHLAWDDDHVEIAGETVPLESQPSAALALTFNGIPVQALEIFGFLGRFAGIERRPLVSATPYRPGLIPVVFVHGTASSPVRWAEMFNVLQAHPEVRKRYQFWFFQYDSDRPIAMSSLELRNELEQALQRLDPEGADPALHKMVLIGHSQGGLLVKMQAIDAGDRIWNAVAKKPISELVLHDETRELLEQAMFPKPLPAVSRVVFISTPHRGSFLASNLVGKLARALTHLPTQFDKVSRDLMRNVGATRSTVVPSAVDNMSPGHPFITGLQSISVDPSIPAHSIISVDGDGPVEEGDDGVVAYTSAHIDEARSEVVVPSPHSCQAHPATLAEVLRILQLHEAPATDGVGASAHSVAPAETAAPAVPSAP